MQNASEDGDRPPGVIPIQSNYTKIYRADFQLKRVKLRNGTPAWEWPLLKRMPAGACVSCVHFVWDDLGIVFALY